MQATHNFYAFMQMVSERAILSCSMKDLFLTFV